MKKILIVDADSNQAYLFKENLEVLGYRVVDVVPEGREAILAVITRAPDLIIMDVNPQGLLDGIVVVDRIRRFSLVPVIFITANLNSTIAERAGRTPRSLFMHKPVDFQTLANNIRLLLKID